MNVFLIQTGVLRDVHPDRRGRVGVACASIATLAIGATACGVPGDPAASTGYVAMSVSGDASESGESGDSVDPGRSAVSGHPENPATVQIAFGDVREENFVLWARAPYAGRVEIELETRDEVRQIWHTGFESTGDDIPRQWQIDGLHPATAYRAKWRFLPASGRKMRSGSARIVSAPARDTPSAVRLAFGGDLSGQGACRDLRRSFPIFAEIRARAPDVFVALGDMIYADDLCGATGRYGNPQLTRATGKAASLEAFRAHWRYNLDDPELASLRAQTAWVATWDDHEVVNDFGPANAVADFAPGVSLLQPGRRALFEFNPIASERGQQGLLYRSLRYGRHLELFVLDTRQYRDPNRKPDTQGAAKTLLGDTQRDWLLDALANSDATWKLVVSSVPLSIPTGFPREKGADGWAPGMAQSGFGRERDALLRSLQRADVRGMVWITADVHFATGFRYRPFADAPEFVFHEFVVGPLNAGVFPNTDLDPTLRPERLFFHGPSAVDAIADYEKALGWFNFGWIEIAQDGALDFAVLDARGRKVYELTLP